MGPACTPLIDEEGLSFVLEGDRPEMLMAHAFRDVQMGVAVVDENQCVSHLRTGSCGACYTACPLRGDAITQGLYNAPTVHPKKCVGCGMCAHMCPRGVLKLESPSRRSLSVVDT